MVQFFPLAFHPPPHPNEDIGQWIKRLADANEVSFTIMITYIFKLAHEQDDFIKTLSDLTGLPEKKITLLSNPFSPYFWIDLTECPILHCGYETKSETRMGNHIHRSHSIGCEWYSCHAFNCSFKTKRKKVLENHLERRHNSDLFRFRCYLCFFLTNNRYELRKHLNQVHNKKNMVYGCPLCDYQARHSNYIKNHLIKNHYIELLYPDKPLLDWMGWKKREIFPK